MSAPQSAIVAAVRSLTGQHRVLWNEFYVQAKPRAAAAASMGITLGDFDRVHGEMLKGLRHGK